MLYTCLYNIFLNVEAVHSLEKSFIIFWVFFLFSFFQLALAWRFSVSLGSPCYVSIAAYSSQSVPAKIKEDKPGDRVEECRKQCRVDFQLETCGKQQMAGKNTS